VNRRDASLLVLFSGLLALDVGVTGKVVQFLRPGMGPYLIAAGAALTLTGVLVLVDDARRRHDREQPAHRASRTGWLLLAPLVVGIVVAPGALGAYAAGRQGSARSLPTSNFDLAQYVRSAEVAGQVPELPMLDYVSSVADPARRRVLETHTIRLTGFVAPSPGGRGAFRLTRFLITCCAADALAMQVDVRTSSPVGAEDSWVTADVTLLSGGTSRDDTQPPVVVASRMRSIRAPSSPYESLR